MKLECPQRLLPLWIKILRLGMYLGRIGLLVFIILILVVTLIQVLITMGCSKDPKWSDWLTSKSDWCINTFSDYLDDLNQYTS